VPQIAIINGAPFVGDSRNIIKNSLVGIFRFGEFPAPGSDGLGAPPAGAPHLAQHPRSGDSRANPQRVYKGQECRGQILPKNADSPNK
jgi:hypothetical protein